jgi:hypothetical protein
MGQVARYDIATLRGPERTPQGFLRADAALTRSGVFSYRNPDGTVRREYRPPEEVFKADSLASFEDAPLTKLHPARLVDKDNARELAVGMVKEAPRRDGDLAVSRVVVMDAGAIAAVESGELPAVSCGYTCDYDPTPGVTPQGERYDGVQRNIVGNHLALVPVGRAGPEARIRLDAADAVMVDATTPTREPREDCAMAVKIRLDGIDYEAGEQLAQAITVSQEKAKARADELEDQLKQAKEATAKEKARADAAEEQLKKAREDAAPAALQKKIDARLSLEREAAKVLGSEAKFDGKTDEQIKVEVITKLHPEAKARIDAEPEATRSVYIQARYDAALEESAEDSERNDDLAEAHRAAETGNRNDGATNNTKRKFYEDEANAWKQKAN